MNAAQARGIARLIDRAQHPRTCPITGQPYTEEELADYGQASARAAGYVSGREAPEGRGELLEVELSVAGLGSPRVRTLYLDEAGEPLLWSTVRIPPEALDCECDDPSFPRSTPPGSEAARRDCPVHGQGVRELDCWRTVRAAEWNIAVRPPITLGTRRESVRAGDQIGGVDVPHQIGGGTPYWKFEVVEGDPLDDPLAKHRTARARQG